MSTLAINRHCGEAVYSQIARMLADEIRNSHAPGAYLPAEDELAGRFGVNRHTLRRAVEELIQSGLVERMHGKGTRVLDVPFDYNVRKTTRFTEQLDAAGLKAETLILRKLVIPAQGGVANRLALPEGAPVLWMETLRQVEGRPYCLISHYLPQSRFPDLLEHFTGGSLHDYLGQHHHILLRRLESLVSASLPLGDDAERLQMPHHLPVLRVKSLNIDVLHETPLEYALTRFRADRIQLNIRP